MMITLLLTLCNIVLVCLMILTATIFMPHRALAKNFPADVQEALQPRLDHIDTMPKTLRIFGGFFIVVLCLLFIGVFLYGGIDGMRHDFTFGQYLLRFLVIAFGVKTFDILALDYYLLTKTNFFQHFFPETKGCAGWQKFGYNRKQHLRQSVIMLLCCLITAFVFSKL